MVAAKAGKPYEELLQERIAGPLKMADCTVSMSSDQQKRLATPHDKYGSAVAPWEFADLPGAGGIHATLRDMMRFAKAQLEPPSGPIGEAIELAWKQHTEADETGPAMGLGWIIAGDGQTRLHDGQTGGTTSTLFINRKLKCAVVILCNTSVKNDEINKLALQIVRKAAGQETLQAPEEEAEEAPEGLAIDEKLRRRLVGRYQLTPDFIFTVKDDEGRLLVTITNQPTNEVFPESPTRWSYRGLDAAIEFKLPKTGRARSLVLHQNGAEQTARRIE
jgi:serine-type D-Ala-D-Ala carboxypeptidase/endopeptidase